MFGQIIFSLIAFLLFFYIFIFKLIKKNDTTYLIILVIQAIGILLNFIQILFKVLNGQLFNIVVYITCIIIPLIIFILENRGINFSETIYMCISKTLMTLGKRKKAKI